MITARRLRRVPVVARHRLTHLTTHPLTRDRPLAAVGRYLRFHTGQLVRPRWVEVPFVNGTYLLARRGVGGATDNLFVHLGDDREIGLLTHLLRHGDRFVDVGANVGAYTVAAASAGAEVIACEPGEAVDVLQRVVDENGLHAHVTIEPVAVGARVGHVAMTTGRDSLNRVRMDGPEDTPMTTVDQLTADRRPIAVKVDVEGFEAEVVDGARHALADPTMLVVILELNGSGAPYGHTDRSVHERMIECGYSAHDYDPRSRCLCPLPSWNRHRFNTIYVRDPDAVRERLRTAPPLTVGPHRL